MTSIFFCCRTQLLVVKSTDSSFNHPGIPVGIYIYIYILGAGGLPMGLGYMDLDYPQ